MTGRSTSNRALVAGGVGNVVEWYDFAVYGAFATAFPARPVGGGGVRPAQ
jgi:MFS transporter, MHS family, proline/betaine transporter